MKYLHERIQFDLPSSLLKMKRGARSASWCNEIAPVVFQMRCSRTKRKS